MTPTSLSWWVAVPWLITILSLIVNNYLSAARDKNTYLRTQISELRAIVRETQELSIKFHCEAYSSGALVSIADNLTRIEQGLAHLRLSFSKKGWAEKLLSNRKANQKAVQKFSSGNSRLIHLRQAITAKNAESESTYLIKSPSDSLVLEMRSRFATFYTLLNEMERECL